MKNKIILSVGLLQIINFCMLNSMDGSYVPEDVQEYTLETTVKKPDFRVHANIQFDGCVLLHTAEASRGDDSPCIAILYKNDDDLRAIKNYSASIQSYKIPGIGDKRSNILSIDSLKDLVNSRKNGRFDPINIKICTETESVSIYSIVASMQPSSVEGKKEIISSPEHLSKTTIFLGVALFAGVIVYFLYNKGYKIPFIS